MNIKKINKWKEVALVLDDIRETAPAEVQAAVKLIITHLAKLMIEEIEK